MVKNMMNTIASAAIGLTVCVYLYGLNAGWSLPFHDNPQTGFIAFVVFGFAACSVGIGHGAINVGFSNPLMIVGILFGIINLGIVYTAFTGGQIAFITDYASATLALGASMIMKAIIKIAMNFIYSI